ncbi:hypothetical protein [Ohtaekwangia koreensis]|uniref:Lipocalin-like domain-containing protein n=1 Tax=Ohtaekwangia koreensis TaxID=688867 RepID=A0A1T5ME83_9BACT|nr:hypothetical protein [Ohtaekwangia koreensis]SKC86517.1 hypothetical protein SAMN05660236_5168 [Ohtaekwangia koreensis]
MKHLTRLLSLLILVSAAVFFASCGGDDGDDKTPEETQLDKLKGTWTLTESSVQFDGAGDDRFDGSALKLTFSGNYSAGGKYSYAVTSSSQVNASPWPSGGSWKFGSPVTSSIVRLDSELDGSADVTVAYTLSADSKTLTVQFTYAGSGYVVGRTESVGGPWEFVFTK